MRTFTTAFAILVLQFLPGIFSAAHAESTSGSFGVTIELRTFSEAATADHRCTHRGQAEGQTGTLRISCPATVDVKAIASISASKTGQHQRINAEPGPINRPALTVAAGKPMNSPDPVELTISW
ncbi:hypothetical protein LP414_19045 [Polaromonas sp. P1(28)-13]|nr:hypothetical protein LP414_19045 [Polaromonas sp. P1(28)-13]